MHARCGISPFLVAAAGLLPAVHLTGGGRLGGTEPWGPGDNDVVVNEIHYHPPQASRQEEFIELANRGLHWIDLGGWRFTRGIEFTVPQGTILPPGGYLVVARDAASLRSRLGAAPVVGDFKGSLSDTGEILELRNRGGRVVATVHYRDGHGAEGGLWPESPDGGGPSLELVSMHPDWHRPWYWAPSRVPGGTPGARNSRAESSFSIGEERAASGSSRKPVPERRLRINEARLEPSSAFVEIYNDAAATAHLDGLRLSRDLHGQGGIALDGTLPRRKYLVLRAEKLGEVLSGKGSVLFLLEAGTRRIIDALEVGVRPPPAGSVGKYPDVVGDELVLPRATPGKPNAPPLAVPVVINEIHYHGTTEAEEFVELYNAGKKPVPLKGWKISRAVSFRFPDDAVLAPGGYAVVAQDPAKLRPDFPRAEALLFGPYKGKLSNSSEMVRLTDQWDNPVDRVRYSDSPPWPQGADGGGASLELLNPELDNTWSQAWTLGRPGGSPGAQNSRSVKSMRPVIDGVFHDPPVPRAGETVVIHAHVLDTGRISGVAVIFRELTTRSAPRKVTLSDSGRREDGAPRDGHYAGRLPRLRAGSLVGFHILARDGSGRVGRAPEAEGQEYFFQVEPREKSSGGVRAPGMPVYRVIMPPEDWDRFMKSPRREDNWFRCTFIPSVEGRGIRRRKGRVFYDAEIRFRGNNSRNPRDGRMSYRVRLAGGDYYDGRDRFVFNAVASFRQKAGGDLLRIAGVPTSDATVVRLKTPTFDDRRYVDVEVINDAFLDKKFGASTGDTFRGRRGRPFGADLAFHGTDPAPYLNVYQRVNKKSETDISHLLELLQALDAPDDAGYAAGIEKVVDVHEWALYFAANNVLGNTEGGLSTGDPDDYFLAERPTDGRFVIVPWDQDSTFQQVDRRVFPKLLPTTRQLLQHPRFAPVYHRCLRELLDGPFSLSSFRERTRFLTGVFPAPDLAGLDAFVRRRQSFLRHQYILRPQATLQGDASLAGLGDRLFLTPQVPEVTVVGYVDPAVTFGVQLDGEAAEYDAVAGRWSAARDVARFRAGPNSLWVRTLDGAGEARILQCLNIDVVPRMSTAPARIGTDTTWDTAGGPRVVRGEVTILPGATLRVAAGTSVVCGPDAVLNVRGRIDVEGTELAPVTFRPASRERPWRGVRLLRTGTADGSRQHVLSFCRFEGGRGARAARGAAGGAAGAAPQGSGASSPRQLQGPLAGAFLVADGARVRLENCLFRAIEGAAIGADGSVLELSNVRISDSYDGMRIRGGELDAEGLTMARLSRDGLRAERLTRSGSRLRAGTFEDVGDTAVALDGGKLSLENVLVHAAAVGISVHGGGRLLVSRSTIVGAETGVLVDLPPGFEDAASSRVSPSRVELSRTVLWPCATPLRSGRSSRLQLADCLAAPREAVAAALGDVPAGLATDPPRYRAPNEGDFRLAEGSPGKGAGVTWEEEVEAAAVSPAPRFRTRSPAASR